MKSDFLEPEGGAVTQTGPGGLSKNRPVFTATNVELYIAEAPRCPDIQGMEKKTRAQERKKAAVEGQAIRRK